LSCCHKVSGCRYGRSAEDVRFWSLEKSIGPATPGSRRWRGLWRARRIPPCAFVSLRQPVVRAEGDPTSTPGCRSRTRAVWDTGVPDRFIGRATARPNSYVAGHDLPIGAILRATRNVVIPAASRWRGCLGWDPTAIRKCFSGTIALRMCAVNVGDVRTSTSCRPAAYPTEHIGFFHCHRSGRVPSLDAAACIADKECARRGARLWTVCETEHGLDLA
jgi:hypothetical protein